MLGKIEGRRTKGRQRMRDHRLDEYEFEQGLGVGEGQGSLTCHSSQSHKESDMTEQLN